MNFMFYDVVTQPNDRGWSPIQILRTGTWAHPEYGKFSVTETTLDRMVKNFNDDQMAGKIPVDYDHGTDLTEGNPEEGKAAGWIQKLVREGKKLFAVVKWTPAAVRYIQNEEYKFTSPTYIDSFFHPEREKNVGTYLKAVALTNRPFIKGMDPVALSERAAQLSKEKTMPDPKNPASDLTTVKLGDATVTVREADSQTIVKMFADLAEKARTEDDEKKLSDAETQVKSLTDEVEKLKTRLKDSEDSDRALSELRSTNESLVKRLSDLESKSRNAEAEARIQRATSGPEPKLAPSEVEAYRELALKDPETFDKVIALKAPVVKLGSIGSGQNPSNEGVAEKQKKLNELVREREKQLRDEMPDAKAAQVYRRALEEVRSENPDLALSL